MCLHAVYVKKKQRKKYGFLPEKEAEYKPWECLCIDLIGPYKIWTKKCGHKIPKLRCAMMIECAHQMLRNLIRNFELQDNPYIDMDDPWSGILAAAAFAMCSTYHTTLHALPGHLVFGRDMILNTQYLADWTAIKARKQQLICKNNIIENKKHIPHPYKVGDKVMLENHHANKYEQPYKGPYLVMQINTNGTECLKIGAVTDAMNIRCIHPFKTMSSNANHGGDCSMCHSIVQAQRMSW